MPWMLVCFTAGANMDFALAWESRLALEFDGLNWFRMECTVFVHQSAGGRPALDGRSQLKVECQQKKKNRTAHVLGKILCANKSQGGRNNVGNMSSSETQPEKLTNQGWKLPHHLLEDTFIIRRHSAGRRSRRDHQRLGLSAMQQHQTPSRCTHRLDRQVHGMLAGRRTSSRL